MAAPVPLAILTVDQIVLDILPAAEGLPECSLIVEVLIDVVEAYDTLSLYPPVQVVVSTLFNI